MSLGPRLTSSVADNKKMGEVVDNCWCDASIGINDDSTTLDLLTLVCDAGLCLFLRLWPTILFGIVCIYIFYVGFLVVKSKRKLQTLILILGLIFALGSILEEMTCSGRFLRYLTMIFVVPNFR